METVIWRHLKRADQKIRSFLKPHLHGRKFLARLAWKKYAYQKNSTDYSFTRSFFYRAKPHEPLLGAQFFRHPPDKSSLSSPPDGLSPPKRPLCIVEGNQLRYPEDSVIHLSKDWAQTGFHSLSQSIHFGDNNNNNNNSNTLFRFKRTILQTLTKHS